MHVWFKMCHGQNLDYLPMMGMVLLPLSGNHDHGQNLDFHGGMTIDHIYPSIKCLTMAHMYDHACLICMPYMHKAMIWGMGFRRLNCWRPRHGNSPSMAVSILSAQTRTGEHPQNWMNEFLHVFCFKWLSKLMESHGANPLDAELPLVSI